MNFKVGVDIARVYSTDNKKYTVDMIGISGNHYKNLPFLTLYGKPGSNGQGIYMMPERDSYGLVIKLTNKSFGNFMGSDKFVLGFYNPINDEGSYSGEREEINPGDYVLKTVFGNKIIAKTDGSILISSSNQSLLQLFPASGNKEDSWGFDNLLRAIFENLEITTDGGHLFHKVNKKEKKTNLNFEIRNKPLYSENPDIVRGNIGSQGPLGEEEYFTTIEAIKTSADGEVLTKRSEMKWKTTGWKHLLNYNEEAIKIYELEIDEFGTKKEITYTGTDPNTKKLEILRTHTGLYNEKRYNLENGILIYEIEINEFGTKKEITYTGTNPNSKKLELIREHTGAINRKIYKEGKLARELDIINIGEIKETIFNPDEKEVYKRHTSNDGTTKINIGEDKINIQLNPDGNVDVDIDKVMNLFGEQINLGGEQALPVQTSKTINKHICPVTGAIIAEKPELTTNLADKVNAE